MWKQPEVWQGPWPQIPDHVPLSPCSLLYISRSETPDTGFVVKGKCYPFSQKCPLRWNLLVILTLIVCSCNGDWFLYFPSSSLLSLLSWLRHLIYHHKTFKLVALPPSPGMWSVAHCATVSYIINAEHFYFHNHQPPFNTAYASVIDYWSVRRIQLYRCRLF